MNDNVEPLRAKRPCPQCDKPTIRAYYPFCSKRCADLDLGSWLKGQYAIPAKPDENDGILEIREDSSE